MMFHEVVKSGKPFRHPQMIGAYMYVDDPDPCFRPFITHRNLIFDFRDMNWIKKNCHIDFWDGNFDLYDVVTRNDWYTVDPFDETLDINFGRE